MLNAKCSIRETLIEAGLWLLMPLWLVAFILTIVAGYITLWLCPRYLRKWAFYVWH
jgi:hypothetical protein